MIPQYSTVIDADDERHAEGFGMPTDDGELALTKMMNGYCYAAETGAFENREQAVSALCKEIAALHRKYPDLLSTQVMEEIEWRIVELFEANGWPEWSWLSDFVPRVFSNH